MEWDRGAAPRDDRSEAKLCTAGHALSSRPEMLQLPQRHKQRRRRRRLGVLAALGEQFSNQTHRRCTTTLQRAPVDVIEQAQQPAGIARAAV